MEQPPETHPRRVDGALSRIDEHIVQEASEDTAEKWGNHGNLRQHKELACVINSHSVYSALQSMDLTQK